VYRNARWVEETPGRWELIGDIYEEVWVDDE
jgi:hypothetical protein